MRLEEIDEKDNNEQTSDDTADLVFYLKKHIFDLFVLCQMQTSVLAKVTVSHSIFRAL